MGAEDGIADEHVRDDATPTRSWKWARAISGSCNSNLESDREFAYGLTDEAGKINLNSASEEMLQKLPGMTAELAASIIDWRDEDSDVTTGGAESEYYLLQPTATSARTGRWRRSMRFS